MNRTEVADGAELDQIESIMTVFPDELTQWISYPDQPVIIEFYASWCIYHLLTKKKLENLKRVLGGNVVSGCIDCTGNEELFRRIGVHQVPTIGYFHRDTQILWHGDTDLEIMLDNIHASKVERE